MVLAAWFRDQKWQHQPTPGKFDSEILLSLKWKWKTVWFNSMCDADSFLAGCWHAVSHRNRSINFNWFTEWIDMLHWHFLLTWCWTQAYQYIDHFLLVWYEWQRPARNEWQIMPAWVTADKPSACFWHSGMVLISVADKKMSAMSYTCTRLWMFQVCHPPPEPCGARSSFNRTLTTRFVKPSNQIDPTTDRIHGHNRHNEQIMNRVYNGQPWGNHEVNKPVGSWPLTWCEHVDWDWLLTSNPIDSMNVNEWINQHAMAWRRPWHCLGCSLPVVQVHWHLQVKICNNLIEICLKMGLHCSDEACHMKSFMVGIESWY